MVKKEQVISTQNPTPNHRGVISKSRGVLKANKNKVLKNINKSCSIIDTKTLNMLKLLFKHAADLGSLLHESKSSLPNKTKIMNTYHLLVSTLTNYVEDGKKMEIYSKLYTLEEKDRIKVMIADLEGEIKGMKKLLESDEA